MQWNADPDLLLVTKILHRALTSMGRNGWKAVWCSGKSMNFNQSNGVSPFIVANTSSMSWASWVIFLSFRSLICVIGGKKDQLFDSLVCKTYSSGCQKIYFKVSDVVDVLNYDYFQLGNCPSLVLRRILWSIVIGWGSWFYQLVLKIIWDTHKQSIQLPLNLFCPRFGASS